MAEIIDPSARPAPVTPPGSSPMVGFAFLVLSFGTLGILWPLLRLGVQAMPALWFGWVRLALGSAFFFLLLIALRRFRLPSRQDLPVILSVGVFMMGIYVTLAQIGLQYVGAGRATLLGYTTPLWVTPVAALFLHERMNAYRIIGVVLGLVGLVVLFNPFGFDWSDPDQVMGNGFLILCAMSWGVCIIQMRTQIYRLEPLQLVPWQLLVAAGCVFVAAMVVEPDARIEWTERNIVLIAVAGPVASSVALWSATMTMRHLPAVTSSVGFLGVPVVSTLIAWAFMDEPLTWTLGIGLVVILSGLALVSVGQARGR